MTDPTTLQNSYGPRWTPWQRLVMLLPATAALLVYLLTLSRGAFPGESAWLVVQATGLSPRLYVDRPLWSLAIGALAHLPGNDFVFWFNLFSALCGAAAVYLCVRLVARIVWLAIPAYVHRRYPGNVSLAAVGGGVGAGLFLAFATPFWIAATRAHPATMHLAGFLAVGTLLLRYTRHPTDRQLALLTCLYGIGCVEITSFLVFAPAFAAYVLLFLWLRDLINLRRIMLITASGLAGLSFYLVAAWLVTRTDAFHLRDFQGFWHVLWVYWGDQYRLITRGLPRHGWMLMLTVTALPWTIGILTVKRSLGGDRDPAFRLMYLVMTGLTLLVLFNHPITPWRLLGPGRILVMPYLLSATLFGLLTAGWIMFPIYCTAESDRRLPRIVRLLGGPLVAGLGFVLVLAAPLRNLEDADGRPAEMVNLFAGKIVQSAVGREWLITDGALDHHLLIAAHQASQPLKVLNPGAGSSPVYQRYLAGFFDSLRLRGLLQASMSAFLQEWLATPGVEERVAVLTLPDLWFASDFTVVPHRLVFRGARAEDLPDAESLWAENTVFWSEVQSLLSDYRDTAAPNWSRTAGQFLRHSAMVANNLGVLIEDLERPDLAWQAYRQALELNPANISALLNLSMLTRREGLVPDSVRIETNEAFRQLEESLGERRFRIRGLSVTHGYVRMPHAFADMGWTWALTGNPGMAASGLRRAITLSHDMPGAQAALAAVYLAQERDTEGETVYREILQRHPRDLRALIGLARIGMMRRRFDDAEEHINTAARAGAPSATIMFERAMLALLRGEDQSARQQLAELVAEQPSNTRAWVLLAHIALRQDDAESLARITRQITPLAARDHTAAFALGEIAMAGGDPTRARMYFEQALQIRPGNAYILEKLLRRDLAEARQDLAEQHVRKLLAIDPGHAFGNYVLGTLQLRNHQSGLAETSFRHSLSAQRTPHALTDLANLLIDRGRSPESEPLAREAVDLAPHLSQTWGVLGRSLLYLRRTDEAIEALEKALAFDIGNPQAGVDLAEAFMHIGNTERALANIDVLLEPGGRLNNVQRERVAALRRAIHQSTER